MILLSETITIDKYIIYSILLVLVGFAIITFCIYKINHQKKEDQSKLEDDPNLGTPPTLEELDRKYSVSIPYGLNKSFTLTDITKEEYDIISNMTRPDRRKLIRDLRDGKNIFFIINDYKQRLGTPTISK